jgi:hypothetical protein
MLDQIDAEAVRVIVRAEVDAQRATYFLADLPGGTVPLPIEPLYEIALAAVLIPCTRLSLQGYLARYREQLGPARYRYDAEARRHRMLTASEVRWLRDKIIKTGHRRKRLTS